MAFELSDGQATLHKNKFKVEGDKQPEYRGDIMVNGELMELAAWIKEGKSGKWMALKYSPKREQAAPPAKKAAPSDDIPF